MDRYGRPRPTDPHHVVMLPIHTNAASLNVQRHLGGHAGRVQGHVRRLSSGLRIERAADDPSGLGQSERMRARLRSLGAALRNVEHGVGLVRTADAALGELHGLVGRIRELGVRGMTETLAAGDRAVLDAEFQELRSELRRLVEDTEFDGRPLFRADERIDVQAGAGAGDRIGIPLVDLTRLRLHRGALLAQAHAQPQLVLRLLAPIPPGPVPPGSEGRA